MELRSNEQYSGQCPSFRISVLYTRPLSSSLESTHSVQQAGAVAPRCTASNKVGKILAPRRYIKYIVEDYFNLLFHSLVKDPAPIEKAHIKGRLNRQIILLTLDLDRISQIHLSLRRHTKDSWQPIRGYPNTFALISSPPIPSLSSTTKRSSLLSLLFTTLHVKSLVITTIL